MRTFYKGKKLVEIPYGKKAYVSWLCHKKRALKNKMPYIKDPIKYIEWYLKNIETRDSWKWPTVSRKDHTKGYYFRNMKLEEMSENVSERNSRYTKKIIGYKNSFKKEFNSIKDAAAYCGVAKNNIAACCNKKGRKTLNGFSFKYSV
jgi:hypothetical protein